MRTSGNLPSSFPGARVGTHRTAHGVYTLYEVPDGLYKVCADTPEEAWVEEATATFPELFAGLGLDED